MRDTRIETIRDRLRKEEMVVEWCVRMTLPFAENLEVIKYLRKTLYELGGTNDA